ncbi:MAG: type II toxin-antitoxin system PemK/MazF family toxin [Arcobacteraceae bacterium]|jgi:mRNA interferase MazF|nr:type II toxin-antitoxin system PemK/MazF family toxin [Arcobacteraceae bacterium]
MNYSLGEIVLVKFPFTNLLKSKKRPVLIIKSENELGDIVCFQITSNQEQSNLLKINHENLHNSTLTVESYVKYDKCFTINSSIIDKKIATANENFLTILKERFCNEIF